MSKNDLPKVSIIIPAYNAEKCLEESVKSATNQSYKNIEIIIVNDGSTDKTAQVAKKLSAKNSKIKVVTQENRGLGEARNSGMDVMTGDYVVFLDADDLLFPWAISKCIEEALSSDAGIVCGEMVESAEPKKALKEGSDCETQTSILRDNNGYKEFLYGRIRTSAHAKLYKSGVIKADRFSKIRHAEDLEFNLRIFKKTKNICFITSPAIEVYTLSENSMMRSSYNEKKQEELALLRQLQKDIAAEKRPDTKKALKAALFFHAVGMIGPISDSSETLEKYSADYRELKAMIHKARWSVAHDKNALASQRRYALAACVSVRLMLKMMRRAHVV